ncbi:hypothetical protein [Thomasclavelia sp.]|uniref:hypothetical protein n=1 Tax=Thomasclavelia sp. TaxID=3025757 RepID=UPI0025D98147|nr:hypothetical protein [Thomasclavelia sp.]
MQYIQKKHIIKECNFKINKLEDIDKSNISLNITGNSMIPKNLIFAKKGDIIIQLNLCFGSEKEPFELTMSTEMYLDVKIDPKEKISTNSLEKYCADIALKKLLESSNKFIELSGLPPLTIPNIEFENN